MQGKTLTNPNGRIICVGDLHGCAEEAHELLSVCNLTPNDIVVFLGDLVDRGPDNAGCVDLAMKHECVLGNHEEKHLFYKDREARGKDPQVVSPTHVHTRSQLKPHHFDYFRSLPLFIRFPEHNAVAVHAGVYPGRPIEAQDPHHLLHCQMLNPPNTQSKWPSKVKQEDGWKFWTHLWDGPEKIIFGHSVVDRPLITDKAVGIDGGAVFGYELWAYELPSGKLHRVQSKVNADKGHRGRNTNDRINKIVIHGEVCVFS